jgi:hypothetical protein
MDETTQTPSGSLLKFEDLPGALEVLCIFQASTRNAPKMRKSLLNCRPCPRKRYLAA